MNASSISNGFISTAFICLQTWKRLLILFKKTKNNQNHFCFKFLHQNSSIVLSKCNNDNRKIKYRITATASNCNSGSDTTKFNKCLWPIRTIACNISLMVGIALRNHKLLRLNRSMHTIYAVQSVRKAQKGHIKLF